MEILQKNVTLLIVEEISTVIQLWAAKVKTHMEGFVAEFAMIQYVEKMLLAMETTTKGYVVANMDWLETL